MYYSYIKITIGGNRRVFHIVACLQEVLVYLISKCT